MKKAVFKLDARGIDHQDGIRLLLDLFDRGLNVKAANHFDRWHIRGIQRKAHEYKSQRKAFLDGIKPYIDEDKDKLATAIAKGNGHA